MNRCFVAHPYEPANGHLEVLSKDTDGREALARIVADSLLKSPITGDKIPLKQYDYQSLAAPRSFDLTGEDVASVKVIELAELQKLGTDALAAPAFKGCIADGPAGGELTLIEVHDFHLGLLPNELAGGHEGAVPPSSQGKS
jgi:hypothetical protein